jgi:ABC-type transport system involved in Fe-S cluster assembly fused permease/ATPase subunit
MKGKTTLSITHRLETVQTADKIVVVVDGRVEEEGTYEHLSSK